MRPQCHLPKRNHRIQLWLTIDAFEERLFDFTDHVSTDVNSSSETHYYGSVRTEMLKHYVVPYDYLNPGRAFDKLPQFTIFLKT